MAELDSPAEPIESTLDKAEITQPKNESSAKPSGVPEGGAGLLSRLRSYFILDPLIWLYTLALGLLAIPLGAFDRSGRRLHWFARAWSWLIMKTIMSPVRVRGLDEIDVSKAHVYAANHASALDIPVLYANLPFQFRIVFKSELLKYPVVGWHLRRSGQVCIDQRNPANSIGSIRSALKSLRAGMPLVIFPEGGRTPDGRIQSFMAGAFFLAIKAQVDVVPVALVGTWELLPMDTYYIKCRSLELRAGRPISTEGMTLRDLDQLSSRVQRALEALYYEDHNLRVQTEARTAN